VCCTHIINDAYDWLEEWHGGILQCVAVSYSVLQRVALSCDAYDSRISRVDVVVCCSVLQCVAACCTCL